MKNRTMTKTTSRYRRVLRMTSIILGVFNFSVFTVIPHVEIGDYSLKDVVYFISASLTTLFICLYFYDRKDYTVGMYIIHFSICIMSAVIFFFLLNLIVDEIYIRTILKLSQDFEKINISNAIDIAGIGLFIGFLKPLIIWTRSISSRGTS